MHWDCPRGNRHGGGAKLNQALVRNVRTYTAMPREKMLWGGGGEIVSIVADVNRWSPDAHAERPEPIPYRPETGQHIDRGNRNELVELARCRHRAWRRAPAVKEARGRRERIAEASQSLA